MSNDRPNTILASLPDPLLGPLLDAALAGAERVMAAHDNRFAVETKADSSPVTTADRESEAAILGSLADGMPGVPVVAEEAMATGGAPAIGDRFLLVDPLDGTEEFLQRNGEFTVNVALVEGAEPKAGVVIAPALGFAFAGSAAGAFRARWQQGKVDGWTPIGVRKAPAKPVAVASRSHLTPDTHNFLVWLKVDEYRAVGSSLKFCMVAEGSADIYPRLGPTMEWDTAAGHAVLRAAGGSVVTLDGAPLLYGKASSSVMRPFENPFFVAAGDAGLVKPRAA